MKTNFTQISNAAWLLQKGPFTEFEAYSWLCREAMGDKVFHSIRHMAERWDWPRSTVADFMKRLEKNELIVRAGQKAGRNRVTYLLVFARFSTDCPDKTRTETRTRNNTIIYKDIYSPEFTRLWELWKKDDTKKRSKKAAAFKMYQKWVGDNHTNCLNAATEYLQGLSDKGYTPGLQVWLNGNDFTEETKTRRKYG